MSWARLDDGWHDHEKVAAAGLEAAGLWCMCLTWAFKGRKTSKAPGVVPEAVIVRFAGNKAKRLAAHLHSVGMFDAKTDAGWPIHDFADYLPRYDSDQAKLAGAAGGKARAANRTAKQTATPDSKRTAKQTASEPVAETLAIPSTRASTRRNPVPVPSEGLRPSGADEQRDPGETAEDGSQAPPAGPGELTAQDLVRGWIESLNGITPDSRTKGHVAKEIKRLLTEGVPPDELATGIRLWQAKGLSPGVLASVVHGVRVNGETGQAPRPQQPSAPPPGASVWDKTVRPERKPA